MTEVKSVEHAGSSIRVDISPALENARVAEVHEALDDEKLKAEYPDATVIHAKDTVPPSLSTSGLITIQSKPAKPNDVEWGKDVFAKYEEVKKAKKGNK